uniref:GNAT family N-acetyltransferase n=1 Tax=Yoonia sp. TaxID=2212373 RepID=UPI004047F51B|tara:strand:+ start:87803 stop:88318 length:516 start_codon:yes stop_codon:yes gene_type:complete
MSVTLQTPRLVMRRPQPGDWMVFHDFMMSDRATAFDSRGNLAKVWRAFAAELGHWEIFGYGMWAVTLRGDNDCVGLVGPWTPPDWPETEIGWMMFDPAIEGTGIATEAAAAAVKHAYDVLGWQTAVSYIAHTNARSIRLAEKLGAKLDVGAKAPTPETLVYRHPVPKGVVL